MEEILNSSLNSGEEILWRSHPEDFEILDQTHRSAFLRKAVIGAAIALGFIAILLFTGNLVPKSWILIVIATLLCAIPAINVYNDGSKLRKSEYIATSERLIVLRDAVRSAEYSKILSGGFLKDSDGHTSLLIGREALKAKPTKWREIAVVGMGSQENAEEVARFCFYALQDIEPIKTILHEKVPSIF